MSIVFSFGSLDECASISFCSDFGGNELLIAGLCDKFSDDCSGKLPSFESD